ncbi:2-polyprenyl-3-methyl-5-hydroxy-6-metoxy-1,4-benzoquinol methylase [Blastococcus aggregatus]|uniref:2-polyprenyl-3-methyl-5-hydroxy-6-metoxy-1,4-benzoquinol methylase n=1 Tax=Blastococcus aggregatus TaxID=38502 RepID=A0A285V0Z9_9ACTN|nr:class I SAM-dependent methyltransferase [Blastococcus aggregatus]SOC47723.1 2-polyprenyl-3-methyl-5-hydroxy-6-metoxy-1,4-benzoquinol methylase [Blastococcus aggregatus]
MAMLSRSRSRTTAEGLDVACPACGSPGRPLALVVEPGCRLVGCPGCGTQYLRRIEAGPGSDGRPAGGDDATRTGTDSEYWEEYKFEVYDSDDVRRGYDERYDLAFGMLRGRAGAVRTVLDVGCGVGNFLDWARRHGLDAVGVDVEPRAVAAARDRGLVAAVPDELDDVLGPLGRVDVLTMWDVVEHVFEPGDFLGRFTPYVAPGGALLLETPDAAFPVRAVFRALHWGSRGRVDLIGAMYYWEHKVYFTETGLRRLLATHGFEVVEVRRLTSPRAKMAHTFSHDLERQPSLGGRLLAGAWPLAERVFRRLGLGNKLIVLARRSPTEDVPGPGATG